VPTGPAVNIGDRNLELRTGLITMVQASPFCGLPSEDANAHLQHFLKLCDTSSSKTSHLRLSGSVYFPSLSWGRRNSGSTRTGKLLIYRANAPLRSSLSSSLWAKPMPCGEESPTSSRLQWNPSRRHRRSCKSTSKHALTIGWRTGWCSRTSTMG
jgi:hypothetical protein